MTNRSGKLPGRALAITAEGLYLLNLLFPVVTWLALLVVWLRRRNEAPELGRVHLRQAFVAATLATALFLLLNLLVMALGGYRSMAALVLFEAWFIVIVPIFLIPGLIALLKAMAGETWRFPLIAGWALGGEAA